MNEFTELEYKYKADDIGLKSFQELMNEIGFNEKLDVSSWDIYYTKPDSEDEFIRFRESEKSPELTIKRKVKKGNNFERIEVDLPLNPKKSMNELRKIVQEFVALEGYTENFKIYKACFIYWQEYVNYVYYIVFDEQMVPQGRFIEVEHNKHNIEVNSGKIQYFTSDNVSTTPIYERDVFASDRIREAEKTLDALGITNKNRLKKSLFEMFRR